MPRTWTDEQRKERAEATSRRQPWLKSTGPRTAAGKKICARNAYKHGLRSAGYMKFRAALRRHRIFLKTIDARWREEERRARLQNATNRLIEWGAKDAAARRMRRALALADGAARGDPGLETPRNAALWNRGMKILLKEVKTHGAAAQSLRENKPHDPRGRDLWRALRDRHDSLYRIGAHLVRALKKPSPNWGEGGEPRRGEPGEGAQRR